MVRPGFVMFWSEDVPAWEADDGRASATVWAGDYFGAGSKHNSPPPDSWAADTGNDVAILHLKVRPGGRMVIPSANEDGVNRTLYLIEGWGDGLKVDERVIDKKLYMEVDAMEDVSIEVSESYSDQAEFLLMQGKPINKPVAQYGPFVRNTRAEIDEAFADYQRTEFGGWPRARDDMIFERDKGRFSLLDGKETWPGTNPPKEKNEENEP